MVGALDDLNVDSSPVAYSPDGRIVALRSQDSVTLVDLARPSAPAVLAELPSGWEHVGTPVFSPDGRTLAAGVSPPPSSGRNSAVVLWDITNPARAQQLATVPTPDRVHTDVLAFAPDGRTLAAGIRFGRVMLWDVTDRTAPVHVSVTNRTTRQVSVLRFSPDARTLAVANAKIERDGGVALWDYSELNAVRTDPAAFACAIAGRGLTAAEWRRYVPELPYRRSC
jgi:WD40 repeat protein